MIKKRANNSFNPDKIRDFQHLTDIKEQCKTLAIQAKIKKEKGKAMAIQKGDYHPPEEGNKVIKYGLSLPHQLSIGKYHPVLN